MSAQHRYQIAADGEIIGEFTITEMLEQVRAGASFDAAHYLHPCGQWKPAGPLVNAKIAEAQQTARMRAHLAVAPKDGVARAAGPKKKSHALHWLALGAAVPFVCIALFIGLAWLNPPKPVPALSEDQLRALSTAISLGVLRLDEPNYSAWVDTVAWNGMPFERKEAFAAVLAQQCGGWVRIHDKFTGKRLAKYGSWGFTVD